jgi:hypothetical protein
MPEQETASDVETESLPADGGSGASTDWRAENTRLRQELSKVRDLNRQAIPFVNLAIALKQAPGGADIIAKLERGEALTAKQEATVTKVTEAESERTGVSVEALEKLLDSKLFTFEQRLQEGERAKEALKDLYSRADKELPGLREVLQTPEGKRRLNVILGMISQQAIDVPDDEPDPYWWSFKEVYATLRAENPDIGKTKKAAKTEAERRGAIVKASPKSAGAPEEEQLPEDQAFARRPIRRSGIGGYGKSLGEARVR